MYPAKTNNLNATDIVIVSVMGIGVIAIAYAVGWVLFGKK